MSFTRDDILRDYRIGYRSRQASLIGRSEVFTGKAKFGIFGDGKEVPQLAMARAFRKGDFRAGYYRDQTFMLAVGALSLEEFFAQLYADPDADRDPASAGRQMNAHFATHLVDLEGSWLDQVERLNSSADLSPTGSQMPRLVGLAYASKLYRELPELREGFEKFSRDGEEIAFGTIGNASTAEGLFWEAVNAVGVLQAPMLLSIWDDDYGISVPNEYQITKEDLSAILSGFVRGSRKQEGYDLYTVEGWDYPSLVETYLNAAEIVRMEHVPAIIHVVELTQPQGHSTSGSHERYKSDERLAWEEEHDCLRRMREWMLSEEVVGEEELDTMEKEDREQVRSAQQAAWEAFQNPIREERARVLEDLQVLERDSGHSEEIAEIRKRLERKQPILRRDLHGALHEALVITRYESLSAAERLVDWRESQREAIDDRYHSHLTSETPRAATNLAAVEPRYGEDPEEVNGFDLLNACFDEALDRIPNLVAFGEDVGELGDVNQGFAGLQEKYGELRVSDTGIREATIVGQAIGMAMRGLRPLAEIQYLDYILYALQILSDDVATLRYRTKGRQRVPILVRTRGHRLEGIWHSGSLMAGILHLVRGIHVCVPRDMTRAAGFYNLLLQSDDPAIVVEVLNGYRVKEPMPENIGELTIPLGRPEVLREGSDVTVVTYGAMCRIAAEACELLARTGIEVELIDVQTLLPFDTEARIAESVKKTGRVLFTDEDVPGGTTAYMMRQVIEEQGAFWYLQAEPRTLPAAAHRPAYGSDGDYFSKPNREDVFDAVYRLKHEDDPERYPLFYR
ncbi:MAG: thiamine pyrophosphate-dependent enzyme [Thermoanaerobaculia bacterium]|nr:thiamine pyrophosphate-dependent enzyme [Thermoanaerobaculia bacterium]